MGGSRSAWIIGVFFLLQFSAMPVAAEMNPAAGPGAAGRCDSIPLENAAAILEVPVEDLEVTSVDLVVSPEDLRNQVYRNHPYNCTIRSRENLLKSIRYVTYPYSEPVQARMEFIRMRDGFAAVSEIEELPDVGDEAFRAGDKRFQRLVVMHGEVVIDILSPPELHLQKMIALFVLKDINP
jgi:hypothetical protein